MPEKPTSSDISDLLKSFSDFFNYWLLRGLLNCVETICDTPGPFEGMVNADNKDHFAANLATQDCWFDALSTVRDWEGLKIAVKERVIAYRSWANGNSQLPDSIRLSRTTIGEPLSRASEQFKAAGVTSTAFEKLLSLTKNATDPATFAPLGPKPLSVAMCLLASQTNHNPVYYAQPKSYALEYSLGSETTYAYWIKHRGVNLYSITV